MGQHQQPERVPAAGRRRAGLGARLHLHAAQPQLPPPPPPLPRRRRARPVRRRLRRGRHPPPRGPRRRGVPQCGRVPGALLRLRPRSGPRAARRRPGPRRARARDVPRPRRRGLDRGPRPPQEAHDQEPRVRRAIPRAQAGVRPRAGEGGEAPAGGEPDPPRQVRAAEGLHGGAGAVVGEEDAAEGAVRAILKEEQIDRNTAGCGVPFWW